MKKIRSRLDEIFNAKLRMLQATYEGAEPKLIEQSLRDDALYGVIFEDIAHKYAFTALGGRLITSLHRNFGDIIEMSVREIFKVKFDLDGALAQMSLTLKSVEKRSTRTSDATIPFDALEAHERSQIQSLHKHLLNANHGDANKLKGISYEIRQCYKSNDSKRRTADIDMADLLLANKQLPVMLIFCSSSSPSIITDYRRLSKWIILEGNEAFDYVAKLTGFNFKTYLHDKCKLHKKELDKLFG